MKIYGIRATCAACAVAVMSVVAATSPLIRQFVDGFRRAATGALI